MKYVKISLFSRKFMITEFYEDLNWKIPMKKFFELEIFLYTFFFIKFFENVTNVADGVLFTLFRPSFFFLQLFRFRVYIFPGLIFVPNAFE